jgi:hypothetical protein
MRSERCEEKRLKDSDDKLVRFRTFTYCEIVSEIEIDLKFSFIPI